MSASYVVFSTPHSRWIMQGPRERDEDGPDARRRPTAAREAYSLYVERAAEGDNEADGPSSSRSHSLDDGFAEDAVRPNHQRDDHEHVRREVLGAAADQRVDEARGDVLDDAHDQAADDGPGNGVEPAEDDDREDLEADEGEIRIHAEEIAPQHAAEGGDDAGHRPREPEVPLDVDAHRHRDLLVVGDRAHRDALARFEKKPAEPGQEDEADERADELDRRDEERPHHVGLLAERQRQGPRALEDDERPESAQDRREPDGGHDDCDDGPPDELPQHDPLQPKAEDDHGHERRDHGQPERNPGHREPTHDHEARQHHELALREVHGIGGLVDEHEPERDQRVHQPRQDAV